jgi:hypothetical protein
VHDLLVGDWGGAVALLAGSIFIPSLSLALGIWSGNSKLFEVVYLILWYAGPANQIPALDFTGLSPEAVAHGTPVYFLAASAVILAAAFAGRIRQMRLALGAEAFLHAAQLCLTSGRGPGAAAR